ncbi:hypothetical protein PI124_g8811 [Phytophthora idaei]|nr:hypothetical protein PI124_g8811 [Phytophthora idaei]
MGAPLEDGEDGVNETVALVEEERLTMNDPDGDGLDKSGEIANEDKKNAVVSVAAGETVPTGPGEERLSKGDHGSGDEEQLDEPGQVGPEPKKVDGGGVPSHELLCSTRELDLVTTIGANEEEDEYNKELQERLYPLEEEAKRANRNLREGQSDAEDTTRVGLMHSPDSDERDVGDGINGILNEVKQSVDARQPAKQPEVDEAVVLQNVGVDIGNLIRPSPRGVEGGPRGSASVQYAIFRLSNVDTTGSILPDARRGYERRDIVCLVSIRSTVCVNADGKELESRVRSKVIKLSGNLDEPIMKVILALAKESYAQGLDQMKSKIVVRGLKCFKFRKPTVDLKGKGGHRVRFGWSSISQRALKLSRTDTRTG